MADAINHIADAINRIAGAIDDIVDAIDRIAGDSDITAGLIDLLTDRSGRTSPRNLLIPQRFVDVALVTLRFGRGVAGVRVVGAWLIAAATAALGLAELFGAAALARILIWFHSRHRSDPPIPTYSQSGCLPGKTKTHIHVDSQRRVNKDS
ncbi:MAG TPA: hypothetical protein VGF48_18425 [Thermoanaerobaculia bacterium]|jgi:hypothetical protein